MSKRNKTSRACSLHRASETVVEIEDLLTLLQQKVACKAGHGYVIGRSIAQVQKSILSRVNRLAAR